MLQAQITYLSVSAEQEWNKKKGSFVEISYRVDLTDLPDALRSFGYMENIQFRMEWLEHVDAVDWLITDHQHSPFPQRIILIGNSDTQIIGAHRTFLDRKFLEWENSFYNLARLVCRIWLTPVLAAAKDTIDMDRQTGYYRLIAKTEGNPSLTPPSPAVNF